MEPKTMRIAELARRGGVSTATLRYYEEQGLIDPDARTESGYRLYAEGTLCRLQFILRAKALGLTLQEIHHMHAHLSSGNAAPRGHIGDCECWLPQGKEVKQMMAHAETAGCPCRGCTCPSSDGTCSCCGCACPRS